MADRSFPAAWEPGSGSPPPQPNLPDLGIDDPQDRVSESEEAILNYLSTMYANQMNVYLSEMNNALNYQMFTEQNAWNLARRNEEWAYNDPSAQMQRMVNAGINPIMAVGQLQNSPAQQLTSADWKGASEVGRQEGAHLTGGVPEGWEVALRAGSGILSAVNQGVDNFLAARKQAVSEAIAPSQVAKLEADAAEANKRTELYETIRGFNADSMSDRLLMISKQLQELDARINKTNQDTKVGQALVDKYDAETNLATQQAGAVKDYVQQGFMRLDIMSRANDINQQNANTQFKVFQNSKNFYDFQMKHAKVSDIMDYLRIFSTDIRGQLSIGGHYDSRLGFGGTGISAGVSGSAEVEARSKLPAVSKASAAVDELYNRFVEHPTAQNLKNFSEAIELAEPALQFNPPDWRDLYNQYPVSTSLTNPQ